MRARSVSDPEPPRDRPGESADRLRQRFLAWVMHRFGGRHDRLIAHRKASLLGPLTGDILEVGPGTGVNLRYYASGIHWIGLEPNPFMHSHLQDTARRLGLHIDLRRGTGERIELPDGSIDAVVATLVLCSVKDIAAVLQEVHRVLKPGGKFVFVEHVAAPVGTGLRRLQNLGTPLTRWLGDGCHLNRETWHFIESAGFREVRCEHLRLPIPLNGPHIAGYAVL